MAVTAAARGIAPGRPRVFASLAFYAAFYGGTLPYLAAGLVAAALGRRPLERVALSWSRWHRACMTRLIGIRVVVEGSPPPPGALLAIKHESFYDALDLPVLFGRPAIFAKAELLRLPLWGRAARAYGIIPVDRDAGAGALRAMLATARTVAADGRLLAIFPEGTRVPHGQAPPLQAGFAGLSRLLGRPVVPVAIDSGPLYHGWWKRSGTIHVLIGEAIAPDLPRAEMEARVHAAINAANGR